MLGAHQRSLENTKIRVGDHFQEPIFFTSFSWMQVFFLTSVPLSIVSVISTLPSSFSFSYLLTESSLPSFLYTFSMTYFVCWPLTVSQWLDSEQSQPQLQSFSSGFVYFDSTTVLAYYGFPKMLLISFQKSSKKLPNPKSSKALFFFESTIASQALATSANLVAASGVGSFFGWFKRARFRQASLTSSMVASFFRPRTLQGSQASCLLGQCFLKNSFSASVLHQFYLKNCSNIELGSLLSWFSSSGLQGAQFLTLILQEGLNNLRWKGKKGSAKSSKGLKQNRLIQSSSLYYKPDLILVKFIGPLKSRQFQNTILSHLTFNIMLPKRANRAFKICQKGLILVVGQHYQVHVV